MARLNDDTFSRGLETARVLLGHPGFTAELAAAIRKPDGADKAVEALLAAFGLAGTNQHARASQERVPGSGHANDRNEANPFKQTVEEQINALREANLEERWGISEEVINRLAENAPAWPEGKDSYRLFRIRFGEGDEGVLDTFFAHINRIQNVLGGDFCSVDPLIWNLDAEEAAGRLCLLSGNASHKPVVEWIIVHLDVHRNRESVESVRDLQSLADEGLVMAWLFPERAKKSGDGEWSNWFCAGYEIDASETSSNALCCQYQAEEDLLVVVYGLLDDKNDGFSVPVFEK